MKTNALSMTPKAEIFFTAFKSLSKKDKNSFYIALAKDQKLFEDLRDIALLEKRRKEPSRSFREFLNENH